MTHERCLSFLHLMAREHRETASEQQQQQWGTLEELLLACAVNRHGTKSWDSIAMEVQNRTSTLSSLTPQNCRDKFNEIRRRFVAQNDAESTSLVPLVDQLRQIRVQQLRAEVQRRDVSIVSLELKVKRLEEDREKSLKADADLERDRKALPEIVPAVDGDGDSNRSFNESNSTTQKPETTNRKQNDDVEGGEDEREPKMKPEPNVENDPVQFLTESEPDREDRDWSSNGKLNENENGNVKEETNEDIDKTASEGKVESVKNKTSGGDGLSEWNELWDESKREGKQSSDVQSSASLSKNKRRRSGEEPDEEEVSPATKKKLLAVKSEPLVRFLGMIRSHRLGSHFERRLRSQESERYKKLVRQHIDLPTIQSRLDRGLYSNCFQKCFRDLLLLFNNFIIFFKKSSQEHAAARELRALVIKEMTDKLRKQKPTTVTKPKTKPVPLLKANRASTMVVCGKRGSIKPISDNADSKRRDKKGREVEEKQKVSEKKKTDNSFVGIEEKGVKKKRSEEKSVSGRRNSRSSNKSDEGRHEYGGNELSSHDALEVKMGSKKETAVKKKKQGAASFLKRMKQNSPSEVVENDDGDDDVKDNENDSDINGDDESEEESKDSKVEEEEKKRRSGRKRGVNREMVGKSSRGRGVREASGRMKRVVGRPPKRSETTTMAVKRGRDNGENDFGFGGGSGGDRTRKRPRR